MSETGEPGQELGHTESVNESRVLIYEQLMEAQELVAHACYARGVEHRVVLAALDLAEAGISEEQRREDLYLASLEAFVGALGGRVEVRAVFGKESVLVRSRP